MLFRQLISKELSWRRQPTGCLLGTSYGQNIPSPFTATEAYILGMPNHFATWPAGHMIQCWIAPPLSTDYESNLIASMALILGYIRGELIHPSLPCPHPVCLLDVTTTFWTYLKTRMRSIRTKGAAKGYLDSRSPLNKIPISPF